MARYISRTGALSAAVAFSLAVAGCATVTDPAPIAAAPASDQPTSDVLSSLIITPATMIESVPLVPSLAASPAPARSTVTGQAPAAAAAPSDRAAATVVPAPPRHQDIWQRIRAGFAMPGLDTPLVAEKERFYLSRPEALQRMFARGAPYLHFIVEELEKRGMPTELALLPFVESAMNPVALSPAQAAGLWQFIPATGKRYELSQDWWVDERRDVVRSTRAALEYLQTIYEMHDRDWFLALASYNWGENAVARAAQRNRAAGLPADYLSLRMPNETRHYVPKLIALKNILLRADELKLALPPVPNEPYFATIVKTRPIDLKLAAQFAGMSVDEFVALNPAHNRPVIAASRNNLIRLPADRVDGFVAAILRHEKSGKPLASWQPYTLKPGESLDDVSRRGGITAAELLQANGLSRSARLLAGTRIIAPQQTVADEMQVESFAGPRIYEEVRAPAVYHVVQRRETLASVASSYGISVEQLRRWNGAPKSAKPGARLLVRPSATQTVLTTETGSREVVARAEQAVAAPAAAATASAPAARPTAAPKNAPRRTGAVAAAPAVKTVYRPAPSQKRAVSSKAAASKVATGRQPTATRTVAPVRAVPLRTGTATQPVRAAPKKAPRT